MMEPQQLIHKRATYTKKNKTIVYLGAHADHDAVVSFANHDCSFCSTVATEPNPYTNVVSYIFMSRNERITRYERRELQEEKKNRNIKPDPDPDH